MYLILQSDCLLCRMYFFSSGMRSQLLGAIPQLLGAITQFFGGTAPIYERTVQIFGGIAPKLKGGVENVPRG